MTLYSQMRLRGAPGQLRTRQQATRQIIAPSRTRAVLRPTRASLSPDPSERPEQSASESIPTAVRDAVSASIASRSYALTVGDAAAESGVSLAEASRALSALALDSKATLSVSPAGEILYEFPRNFKEAVAARSLRIRMEPLLKKSSIVAAYLGRVTFGSALLVSLATVALALSVLSSKSNDRDSRYSSGHPRMYFSVIDWWWYFGDPYYYRRRRVVDPQEMGFLESIYSCVFGDGDPNENVFEQQRWNALGRYIQSRGGVATAEELAPFLDASTTEFGAAIDADGLVVQESFVLPALTRFGGEPQVDATGNIVYVFESLQSTASARPMPVPYDAVLEQEWTLTRATTPQKILVGLLAAANLVGVVALSVSLQNPRNLYILTINGLQGIVGAMPFLQAYAVSFVAIPLIRWADIQRKNAAIADRNEARMRAAESLMQPSTSLRAKIASGVKFAQAVLVGRGNAVWDTSEDRSFDDSLERERWDRILDERQR